MEYFRCPINPWAWLILSFIMSSWVLGHSYIHGGISMAAEKPRTLFFLFGDSLIDVGNNNHLKYCLARADFPWYGIDYNSGIPTGRFTNGRTIPDIISAKLGLDSSPAYLSLSKKAENTVMLNGVNYASGGAGILNETGFLFIQKIPFDKQIDNFQATKEALTTTMDAVAAENLLNEAIYFVVIGSNDYINNYLLPVNVTNAQQNTPRQFTRLLITSLRRQFKRIYRLGARKILFNGIAPLGCIPAQRVKNGGLCLENVNRWVKMFNVSIKKLLRELNSKLPGINITYLDTYNNFMELIQNSTAYGFTVSDTPCCAIETDFGEFCLPNSQVCADHSKYVFWDAFHPTDAANVVLAQMFLSMPGALQLITPSSSAPAPSPSPTTTIPAFAPSPATVNSQE